MKTDYDVLIIGAGLSGIGMACHLVKECPDKRVGILERRSAIGGTWDLFRYPGIRSDSDMFSFSYKFRPWHEPKVLADGPSIRRYIADTAREYGVDKCIQFGLKILRAAWSSEQRCWTVTAQKEGSGETSTVTCKYLISCTGYYNYDRGYRPDFPGLERFQGICIHPQHWPEGLDYRGKRVVVIGSGQRRSCWCRPWPTRRSMSRCCSARPAMCFRCRHTTRSLPLCKRCCRRAGSTA